MGSQVHRKSEYPVSPVGARNFLKDSRPHSRPLRIFHRIWTTSTSRARQGASFRFGERSPNGRGSPNAIGVAQTRNGNRQIVLTRLKCFSVASSGEISIKIRSFEPRDQGACVGLYREGLLGGKLAENDSGLDVDDVQSAYMRADGNHFWVAETDDGKVIGMIGVQHHDADLGEIKRLRVHPDFRRRGIGSRLIEQALLWCEEHSYLKINVDTFMDREAAVKLFQKFHFLHSRTRVVNGRELHYFYLDIYQREQKRRETGN